MNVHKQLADIAGGLQTCLFIRNLGFIREKIENKIYDNFRRNIAVIHDNVNWSIQQALYEKHARSDY